MNARGTRYLGLILPALMAALAGACGAGGGGDPPSASTETGGSAGAGTTVATGGNYVRSAGGTGGIGVEEETGLTSAVFGSLDDLVGSGAGGANPTACDYGDVPSCDMTRIEGCCSHLACEFAPANDEWDTYGMETCESLLDCVEQHPGCSTADDPVCFVTGGEDAPCRQLGYAAGHEDPDGIFAFTVELVRCLCGY